MRPLRSSVVIPSLAIFLASMGCSSSSSPPPGPVADATAHDSQADAQQQRDVTSAKPEASQDTGSESSSDAISNPDVHIIIDPQNCVSPTTTSSENGVGGYCSPGGGQCDHAGSGGTPTLCTADFAGTPAHAWFCTLACSAESACGGGGGTCLATPGGQLCIPPACEAAFVGDAQLVDSSFTDVISSDAADASTDAPFHDATASDAPSLDATSHDGSASDAGALDGAHDGALRDAPSDGG